MRLRQALVGAKVIESAENYARANVPGETPIVQERTRDAVFFYDDADFWRQVFVAKDSCFGASVSFAGPVPLSEWVPRVPGLFWRPESAQLRQHAEEAVEGHDLGGVTLRPFGKSSVVSGGVGTLKLPPNDRGFRLGTLTMSANVSTGVPVLITPEVWDHHGFMEGSVVQMASSLTWAPMPIEWSSRFPSTRGIPVGCLVIRAPGDVYRTDGRAGTQIHPFTIMEYTDGATELFDFVFATGITDDANHRAKLERFFDSYKNRNGRNGRYLIGADTTSPLWDALYTSPQDLRRADPAAESHLALLERRVRERLFGADTTTEMLRVICSMPDLDTLRRFSTELGVAPAAWSSGGSLADAAARFLDKAGPARIPGILEKLAIDFPGELAAA
jgi:hypothetical protein